MSKSIDEGTRSYARWSSGCDIRHGHDDGFMSSSETRLLGVRSPFPFLPFSLFTLPLHSTSHSSPHHIYQSVSTNGHRHSSFMGGVTRTLNISYLRAIPIGTTIRIRSILIQHGKTMALIQGRMESVDGKTVYATCEHHKVNVPTPKEHLEIREEMREEKRRLEREGRREKVKL